MHSVPKIGLVDNVVPVKDGPGFVAADGLCYALRDSRPHHVRHSPPTEIVKDAPDIPGFTVALFAHMPLNRPIATVTYKVPQAHRNTSRHPSLAKIANRPALLVKHKSRQEH